MNSDIICVLGGTFNPVHTGHIEIARHVHSQFNLDKILIMPSGNPSSYKDTSLIADAKDRCNMISLSIKDYPYMELSELEVKRPGRTYTCDTLKILKEKYNLIYFIIGADSLFSIDKWYHADYVMKNCHLLAANRDNLDDEMIKQRIEFLKNTYGALIDIIDTPALPYSSTVIRENLKNGVSVEKMINPAVYDYIMKHGLYGVKSSKLEE